jgi:hypothetical protein
MRRRRPISICLVFPVCTAKPISLQAFNNTSADDANLVSGDI